MNWKDKFVELQIKAAIKECVNDHNILDVNEVLDGFFHAYQDIPWTKEERMEAAGMIEKEFYAQKKDVKKIKITLSSDKNMN